MRAAKKSLKIFFLKIFMGTIESEKLKLTWKFLYKVQESWPPSDEVMIGITVFACVYVR
jgi:hypothetical protein